MGKIFGKKIKFAPVDEMTEKQKAKEIERLTERLNELYPVRELGKVGEQILIMQVCKTKH